MKKKILIFSIITIIMMAIIVGGAYIYTQNSKINKYEVDKSNIKSDGIEIQEQENVNKIEEIKNEITNDEQKIVTQNDEVQVQEDLTNQEEIVVEENKASQNESKSQDTKLTKSDMANQKKEEVKENIQPPIAETTKEETKQEVITPKKQETIYCVDGGKTHIYGDGANEHGYYKTWDEAFKAYEEYTKGWESTQFKIDQCACGLYYFWVTK